MTETKSDVVNKVAKQIPLGFNAPAKWHTFCEWIPCFGWI